jgi:RNA polymerase-associated protein RTF1
MPLKKRMSLAAVGGGDAEDASEEDASEEDDGYGSDFMGDDADRARLAAMTELQREDVLFQRAEQRNQVQDRRRLREETRARKAADTAAAGRKGAAAKAGARTRAPKRTAADAALDEIKARTVRQQASRAEARAAAAARRAAEAERRAAASEEEAEEASGSERSDEGGARRRGRGRGRGASRSASRSRSASEEEDEAPALFGDISRAVLPRLQLEKWADKPFFDDTLPGCFVRIGTGPGPDGRTPQYRLAEIASVLSGTHRGAELRSYEFGLPGRRTAKWLLLRHGEQERAFKLALVSNAPATEAEFESWARAAQRAGRRPLTLSQIGARVAAIAAASQYRWASADVARAVAEKRAANAAPRNAALEKEQLLLRLEVAEQAGDVDEASQCRAAIADCDAALELLPRGGAVMTNINRRNATANVAILDVAAREAAAAAAVRATGGSKASDVDPFSRRRTQVTNYWQTNKDRAGDAAKSAAPPAAVAGGAAPVADAAPAADAAAPPPPPEAAPAGDTQAASQADGFGGDGEVLVGGAPADAGPSALAAAHMAAWEPLDASRAQGPRMLPVLRGWKGGSGVAEAALRAGITLITTHEYFKRRGLTRGE